MSDEIPDILDALSGIVADFGPVDWDSLAADHQSIAGTLAVFRQIEGIASGHREAMRTGIAGTVAVSIDRASGTFLPHSVLPASPHGVEAAPGLHLSGGTHRADSSGSAIQRPARSRDVPFFWGPLIVRELLASGATGDVYRAFDPKLQREVALKLQAIPPIAEDASGHSVLAAPALTEARRLARVRHANVLSVHGADVADGMVGVWTDLVQGRTLEDKLRREGEIGATEASMIGIDICRALRAVHEAALVHGDVKAANVMRDEEGNIILLDFGSARILSDGDIDGDRISGTPLVMAPEVLQGGDPTVVSDIYATGVLLYRLVSAEYPVFASTLEELMEKHSSNLSPVPLGERRTDLPDEFVRIVETAMARDPDLRFRSAREMEDALRQFLEQRASKASLNRPGATIAAHNLPLEVSSFIGRNAEIKHLKPLVQEQRLVTITGPGGCGKTRLALQVAASLLVGAFDEVRFVDLSACSGPARLAPLIRDGFSFRDSALSLADLLRERLKDRNALLVLDNCEHLVEACRDFVTDVLPRAAGLTILCTSRELLGARGEIVYPLAALRVPPDGKCTIEEVRRADAAALFLERAAATGVPLVLDTESAALLAEICRRLEGIPLAIELAAARVRSLSLGQILDRLEDRWRLLTGGPAGRPRHQTLRAMIDWSYGLLADPERIVFERLGIFVGGWTLEAAESVIESEDVERDAVLGFIERLLDKSLIERVPTPGPAEARYRMLETLREYARMRLVERGEYDRLAARHRDYFAALVHRIVPKLRTNDEGQGISQLRADLDNVRVGLETSLNGIGPSSLVADFGADIARLWFSLDLYTEGRAYNRRFLSRRDPEGDASVARFHLHISSGFLAAQQTDLGDAGVHFDAALRIAEARNEERLLQVAYAYLGNLAYSEERTADARKYLERALAIARTRDDACTIGVCLSNLATVREQQGDPVGARGLHAESLVWARRVGDRRSMAFAMARLGDLHLIDHCFEEAQRYLAESLELREELGDRWGIGAAKSGLADVLVRIGQNEQARALHEEAAAIFEELGDMSSLARTVGRLAEASMAVDDFERALKEARRALGMVAASGLRRDFATDLLLVAVITSEMKEWERSGRLLGAAERILSEIEASPVPEVVHELARQKQAVIEALGQASADRVFREGYSMDDAAALAEGMRPTIA